MTDQQELDEIDLRILSELQKDGRIRNNELANRVGVSEPPCCGASGRCAAEA
ncbi:DNA-binding Lrp family transcriptional regulator [Bradyrhizobium sp. AZCC 2289]